MKNSKFIYRCSLFLMILCMFTGCNKEKAEELKKQFKSKEESFQINAPEDFKESSEQEEGMILIEDEKGQLTILIQQFLKSEIVIPLEKGEDFVEVYRQGVGSTWGEATKSTENPKIDAADLIEAEEYSIVDSGLKEKIYVAYLETEVAYYIAVATGLEEVYDKRLETLKSCVGSFQEDTEKIAASIQDTTVKLSDTLLWFNGTYALITTRNGGDLQLVGGYECNDTTKQMMAEELKNKWDVTDKTSAKETLQWLLEEGHNSDLLKLYGDYKLNSYTREELEEELESDGITGLDAISILLAYDAVKKYGDHAILAWDFSRAMQLSAWYYLAGYYTYEEAMDQSLEIAKLLQTTYSSWDDMVESYLYGFQYWNKDDSSDPSSESYGRKQIYEQLKTQEGSPYQLDWNMTLTKEW